MQEVEGILYRLTRLVGKQTKTPIPGMILIINPSLPHLLGLEDYKST